MERKNVNRGFKKLIVWQDAISLYVMAHELLSNFPFELKRVASNCIDPNVAKVEDAADSRRQG